MLPSQLAPQTAARRGCHFLECCLRLRQAAPSSLPQHRQPSQCTMPQSAPAKLPGAKATCLNSWQRAPPSTGRAGRPGPCQRGPAGRRRLTRPVCCSLHKGSRTRWHCRAQMGKKPHMQSCRGPSAARAAGPMMPSLPSHCCHQRRLDSEAPQQLLHLPQGGAIQLKVHKICGAHHGEGQHSASGSHALCAAASHRSRSREVQSESCTASRLHRAQDWHTELSAWIPGTEDALDGTLLQLGLVSPRLMDLRG